MDATVHITIKQTIGKTLRHFYTYRSVQEIDRGWNLFAGSFFEFASSCEAAVVWISTALTINLLYMQKVVKGNFENGQGCSKKVSSNV
jgi:hypothetical protein